LWVAEKIYSFSTMVKGKWTKGIVSEIEGVGEKKWAVDYIIDEKLREYFSEASKKLSFEANVLLEEQEKSFSVSHGNIKDDLLDGVPTYFLDPICYSTDHSRWLMINKSVFPSRAFFIGGWTDKSYSDATLTDMKVGIHYSLGSRNYFIGLQVDSGRYITLLNGSEYTLPDFSYIQKPILAFACYSNSGYDIIGKVASEMSKKYSVFMGTGGTALDQALVFEGRIEGLLDLRALIARDKGASLMPHDIAAIYPLSKGLGLAVSRVSGNLANARIFGEEPIDIILARKEIHNKVRDNVLEILKNI